MTDPSGLETGDYYSITLGFASGNRHLFPGPPKSIESDIFSCCPRDQSLFVYYNSLML